MAQVMKMKEGATQLEVRDQMCKDPEGAKTAIEGSTGTMKECMQKQVATDPPKFSVADLKTIQAIESAKTPDEKAKLQKQMIDTMNECKHKALSS